MKKFNVTVNGVSYEVVVEEVAADAVVTPQIAAPAAPVQPAAKAPAPKAAPAAPAGTVPVKSPFPGTVLKVNVAAGQSVKKDETLMVVEAMKMENEIKSPQDGVVASVAVSKGATVATDDILLTLK